MERLNGIGIHYQLLGAGEPVAFLNGILMTGQSWVLQTALLRRSHRCLLHDFRGQLLSEKPAAAWTMEDHAADLEALLDHLEIGSCHLVGTSYGGAVGLLFALRCPERVRSLAVISSASEVDGELDRKVAAWARVARETPGELYRFAVPDNFSPAFVDARPEVVAEGEKRLAGVPPDFFSGLEGLIQAFRGLDCTAELPRITCPTLVLVGELDRLKPAHSSRLIAERIPGAERLLVPGAGHAVVVERPEEVNTALLGFLAKHG